MDVQSNTETSSREKVLMAAQQLIVDHGFVDFSMRELAEESGLAKATIYHHFPDKETICRHVIENELESLRDRIVKAANSEAEPAARIDAIIQQLFGPEVERRIAVLMTVRELPGLGMHLHEIVAKYRLDLIAPIAEVIQDGIDKGVFRPVNVDLTVLSLMGIMQSFVTHRLMVPAGDQIDNMVEHTTDLLLNGIIQPERKSNYSSG